MTEATAEQARWKLEAFGFKTPEEFESRRGEKWEAPDTRNHRSTSNGIEREVREPDAIEVDDARTPLIAPLLEGRRIVKFEREKDSRAECHGENSVTLTLDDGSTLYFTGWGYDASGLDTTYEPPPQH